MEQNEIKKGLENCFRTFEESNNEEEESEKKCQELEQEYERRVAELRLFREEVDQFKKEADKKSHDKIDKADITLHSNLRDAILKLYIDRSVSKGKIAKLQQINEDIENQTAKFSDYVTFAEHGNKMILSLERECEDNKDFNAKQNPIVTLDRDVGKSKMKEFITQFFPKEEQK